MPRIGDTTKHCNTLFIPGIGNPKSDVVKQQEAVYNQMSVFKEFNGSVSAVYTTNVNRVYDGLKGLCENILGGFGIMTLTERVIHRELVNLATPLQTNEKLFVVTFSRGVIETCCALAHINNELKSKMVIFAIGSPEMIPTWIAGKAYVKQISSARDPIMLTVIFLSDPRCSMKQIDLVPASSGAKWFDHEFLGPTYQEAFRDFLKKSMDSQTEQDKK